MPKTLAMATVDALQMAGVIVQRGAFCCSLFVYCAENQRSWEGSDCSVLYVDLEHSGRVAATVVISIMVIISFIQSRLNSNVLLTLPRAFAGLHHLCFHNILSASPLPVRPQLPVSSPHL